jgi:hypothetical protein
MSADSKPSGTDSGSNEVVSFDVNEQQMDFLRRVSEAEQVPFDPAAMTRRCLMEFDAELRRLDHEGRPR